MAREPGYPDRAYGGRLVMPLLALLFISTTGIESQQPSERHYDLEWSLATEPVYVGQTVAVSLDIFDSSEFFFPEDIRVEAPSGVLFEEIEGLGEIDIYRVGEEELLRFPVAVFLLTASTPIGVTLPSAVVIGNRLRRVASARHFEVAPPPEPEPMAIGTFSFTAELSSTEIIEGDDALLTMQVEGIGNLRHLRFPEIEAEGVTIREEGDTVEMLPNRSGYRGIRQRVMRLAPVGVGTIPIHIAPFHWFNPESATMERRPEQRLELLVTATASPKKPQDNGTQSFPDLLSAVEIAAVHPAALYRRPWIYLVAILSPILLCLMVLMLRRRRRLLKPAGLMSAALLFVGAINIADIPKISLDSGQTAYLTKDYRSALAHFEAAARLLPDSPGILYNIALTRFVLGNHAESVYLLRRSLRLNPLFDEGRDALDWVEGRLGLEGQPPPMPRLSPDFFLLFCLIAAPMIAFGITLLPRWSNGAFILNAACALSLSLFGVVGLGYTLSRQAAPVTVIGGGAGQLLRIPTANAQPWVTLQPGTALRQIVVYDDFHHVRTGYGVDGWIEQEALLHRDYRSR